MTASRTERELPHALRVLEFPRVLDLIAREATSEPGGARVRALRPHPDPDTAREALLAAEEMAAFLLREDGWALGPVPDLSGAFRRLRVADSVLEPEPLRLTGVLLATARRARRQLLAGVATGRERVTKLAERLAREPELQERLARSFDEAGEVADGASAELRRLRRDLRARRAELVARLERFAAELSERHRVPDASVTVRAGRYCIPVRREGRSLVGGIVHDESASRQTLFIEPPLAIEPMNGIRELELAEAREVRRILAELTDALRPKVGELERTLEALAELDGLRARARYALAHGGARPALGDAEGRGPYRVVRGRHPLLLESEESAVPFDLELSPEETVLLVSGPNAGGKTVLLKSVGILSAMAQSGVVPPVGPETRLPAFDRFFAVIGDEQSIEASLSTFSAQVGNLREILQGAGPRSLVLADEIGSSTDPAEGAALASAVLLRLSEQAALTVATTHLGDLKTLAGETPRVVNASLQFDAEALRPTFRLRRDRPGRSYALEIAARHGLPDEVLREARTRLSMEERSLDRLLRELEEREGDLEELEMGLRRRERALERQEEEAAERHERLDRLGSELERRERDVERDARERVERYLLEARERVEEAIRRLEERYGAAASTRGPAGAGSAEEEDSRRAAASEARADVERAVREAREETPEAEPREASPQELREGDAVRIASLERVGELQELRGDRAVVSAGGLRLTVPTAELERAAEGPPERKRSATAEGGREGARPELEPRPEVDLRGLRVEEVERALLPALDAAIFADLPRFRIIHGKGTGALRERVRELLRADPRVPRVRGGDRSEGGSGVTVAEFREEES